MLKLYILEFSAEMTKKYCKTAVICVKELRLESLSSTSAPLNHSTIQVFIDCTTEADSSICLGST